ncbi:hypothetical protein E2C01_029645 [Portunus trituberculatus]|uniref:Uncharacterized protein n=1 Tax=Portunus trituberculatus TaxID=210409 RepID=A0A5B7ESG8_PORTR|nr:hypothetical protein [Portunus trituberculatus]
MLSNVILCFETLATSITLELDQSCLPLGHPGQQAWTSPHLTQTAAAVHSCCCPEPSTQPARWSHFRAQQGTRPGNLQQQ